VRLLSKTLTIATAFSLVAGSINWQIPAQAADALSEEELVSSINSGTNLGPGAEELRPAITTNDNQATSVSSSPEDRSSQSLLDSRTNLHKKNYLPKQAPTGASAKVIHLQAIGTSSESNISGPGAAVTQAVQKENIPLEHPQIKALISINDYLSPFSLDANSAQKIKLRDVLLTGMDQNLDLAISQTNSKVQQWNYLSALGKFLPDITMSYLENFAKGTIVFPFNSFAGSLPGTGTVTSHTIGKVNTKARIDNPFIIMSPGFRFYGYRGGRILFGALQAKHNYKAARAGQNATLSDTLLTLTKDYYNLMLAETILQIRIEAVHTSEEQLRNNTNLYHSGLATNLDVLQSQTQLARDRQSLVDQQVVRRNGAITLAEALNVDLGADLLPVDRIVRKIRLIDPRLTVSDLLRISIDNRPELKQYEELRLAAKRAIVVAGAPLQPTFALTGNIYGIGPPSQIGTLYALGLNVNWQMGGLGTVDLANVQASRWQARVAQIQANKELVTVLGQVRSSFLQSLDTEHNIEEASNEVMSSAEELRLAQLRFSSGLGTNLDIITSQRDYTQALIDKAQTIINFDIAQAQLLHDTGLISVDSLTSGRLLTQ